MHPKRERSFRYTAKTVEGETVRGTAVAPDRSALSRSLHAQGLYLLSARERRKGPALKSGALAELCRQLSGLVSSGVGVVRGLEILSKEEGMEEEVRRLCAVLLDQVRRGVPLSRAMEAQQARQRDIQSFYAAYPGVDPKSIPQEVWAEVQAGQTLTNAYTMHENKRLQAEIAAMKQNEKNKAKSPGSLGGNSGKEMDEIDRLWAEDD